MLLTHIHGLQCPSVLTAGLRHTVYTNNEWNVSDLHLETVSEPRARFSISEADLPKELPSWVGRFHDVEMLAQQLDQIDSIPFCRVYTFAIASSFLLRREFDVRCRSICWCQPNQFATISWGSEEKYDIKVRHDDLVFLWDSESMKLDLVAPKNVGRRNIDPVRDRLSWQFHQATTYELSFEDIEKLSNAELSESEWRIVQ